MSTTNNTSLTFLVPLPEAAKATMQEVLDAGEFSHDWDEAPAVLDQLPSGAVTLVARNCPYDERGEILTLAKGFDFSVIIHCEELGSYELEVASDVVAFEAKTGREVSFSATNNSHDPLITLEQHLTLSPADFREQFLLPKDILEAQGEDAPAWCKLLQRMS